jgi:hypothetical protein
MNSPSVPWVLHSLPSSSSLTRSIKLRLARSANYDTPSGNSVNLYHGAKPFMRSRQSLSHSRISKRLCNFKIHYRIHKSPLVVPTVTCHQVVLRLRIEEVVFRYGE